MLVDRLRKLDDRLFVDNTWRAAGQRRDDRGSVGKLPDAISEEGGATLAGVGLLQTVGLLRFEAVAGADLSTELLADRLRQFGYVYLIFWGRNRRREVFSHAVVVSNARGGRMRVMDPGENRGLQTTATSYYRNALAMFIGTHIREHKA